MTEQDAKFYRFIFGGLGISFLIALLIINLFAIFDGWYQRYAVLVAIADVLGVCVSGAMLANYFAHGVYLPKPTEKK
jgi:hypothetical protein